ncbi:MAG: GntR family transcriptional regulator [Clostridiales bacterium]|nr:GntR family transcriptional regulator [Clostridiales bacterium]
MIFIDYHSRVPIYEQIKEQVIMLINTGVYKPGDKLPSIRSLSNSLNINVNTIKRAFAELENDGVTYSAQGRGIFVSSNPLENAKIKEGVLDEVKTAVTSAKARGVSEQELHTLIEEIYKAGDFND